MSVEIYSVGTLVATRPHRQDQGEAARHLHLEGVRGRVRELVELCDREAFNGCMDEPRGAARQPGIHRRRHHRYIRIA
jgi:hypothetical protein